MPKVVLEFEIKDDGRVESSVKKMEDALGRLKKTTEATGPAVNRALDQYGEPLERAAQATERVAQAQQAAQKSTSGFSITLGGLGAAVTALNQGWQFANEIYNRTVGQINSVIQPVIALGLQTRNLSYVTGESAEKMSGLLGAARQMDVGADGLTKAMMMLAREVDTGGVSLAKMGIGLRDEQGAMKPLSELLFEVSDKVRGYASSTEAASELTRAFGRGVLDLLPMLKGGRQGIQDAAEASRALGTQMGGADLEAITRYREAVERSNEAWLGFKMRVAPAVLTALSVVYEGLASKKPVATYARQWWAEAGVAVPEEAEAPYRTPAHTAARNRQLPDLVAGMAEASARATALRATDAEQLFSLQVSGQRSAMEAALANAGTPSLELRLQAMRSQAQASKSAVSAAAIQDPRLKAWAEEAGKLIDDQLARQSAAMMSAAAAEARAGLAQAASAAQAAGTESLKAESAGLAAQIARVTAGGGGYGTNPRLYQYSERIQLNIIERERDAQIAAIDETTTARIAGYNRASLFEQDRIRLIASANQSAEAQRQAALDTARSKAEALNAEFKKLGEAAAASGAAITNNITSALEDALREAESLTDTLSAESSRTSTTSGTKAGGGGGGGGVGMSDAYVSADVAFAKARIQEIENRWGITIPKNQADQYIKRQVEGGVGQTEQEAGWARIGLLKQQSWASTSDIGYGIGSSASTEFGAFNAAAGAVVPGPIGSPQRGTAHGGEVIAAPEQIVAAVAAALEQTGIRGRGGNFNVIVQIDGRQLMRAMEIPLGEAIACGRVSIGGHQTRGM